MGKCIIFCAAEFSGLVAPIGPEDLVIAADGGLVHTQALGIRPQVILGDFDSLGYIPTGANVFPVEKDDTDAMLAVRRGLAMGYRKFLLYGSLDGPRLDHTVANFQVLQFLEEQGAQGILVGCDTLVALAGQEALRFPAGKQGTISLFSLTTRSLGVTLTGLYYPLADGELTCGFPLGASNHFTGAPAEISVARGSLLAIWERGDGLPEGWEC